MAQLSAQVIDKGAKLSRNEVYRYRLWRRWGNGDHITFIGLNPSTADATFDDHTIRKCMGFARRLGCDGVEMLNLFALRERQPRQMKAHRSPIGPRNDDYLVQYAKEAKRVVACWGVHGAHLDRADQVMKLLAEHGVELFCFGLTQKGFPRHPLNLAYSTPLVSFPRS